MLYLNQSYSPLIIIIQRISSLKLNLLKVGRDGDLSNYIPNNEWYLVKLHAVRNVVKYSCCDEPYPDITYKIQIRRSHYFIVYLSELLFM